MASIEQLNRVVHLNSASHDFALVVKTLAAARGHWSEAKAFADHLPVRAREALLATKSALQPRPTAGAALSMRAAVPPMGLTDAGAALAPYAKLSEGFFQSLGAFSAFAKIYNAGDFARTPLRTTFAVMTSAPTAAWVSELAAKPLSMGSLKTGTLEAEKASAMLAFSKELALAAGDAAVQRIGREAQRAVGIAVDQKVLSLLASTPGAPSNAQTGSTASGVLSDLALAINALTQGSDSKFYLIISPKLYNAWSLLQSSGGMLIQNGRIGNITPVVSSAATTTAFLIDATQICAELDEIKLDASEQASIEMSDDPTADVFQSASLWQMDCVGVKAEVYFGCVAQRSTSLAMITGYSA